MQGGVDWSKAPDESAAETARLKRYERAALEQEAANNRTLLNAANRAADGDYYGPAWNGGKAFASSTAKRRQEVAAQAASSRVEQGVGSAEDIKFLKTVGRFPSPQRIDSSLMAFAPSGMTKVDGSPVTYSFNERTGQAYWDLGYSDRLREIPRAFRQPSLQEAAFADPNNPFANGPRLGNVLAEAGALAVAGGLGFGGLAIGVRGAMALGAEINSYGLLGTVAPRLPAITGAGLLGTELTLGYNAVSPSPALLGNGVRNAVRFGDSAAASAGERSLVDAAVARIEGTAYRTGEIPHATEVEGLWVHNLGTPRSLSSAIDFADARGAFNSGFVDYSVVRPNQVSVDFGGGLRIRYTSLPDTVFTDEFGEAPLAFYRSNLGETVADRQVSWKQLFGDEATVYIRSSLLTSDRATTAILAHEYKEVSTLFGNIVNNGGSLTAGAVKEMIDYSLHPQAVRFGDALVRRMVQEGF